MSASNEWTEWHLTPRGWERGSEREDFKGTVHRKPPADRVMSATYGERMSSPYSSLKEESGVTWRTEDQKLLNELLQQYGPPPNHL